MPHRVVFAPEARDDLLRLYLFIAERSSDARALAYVQRIEAFCLGFADFPERARGGTISCLAHGWLGLNAEFLSRFMSMVRRWFLTEFFMAAATWQFS